MHIHANPIYFDEPDVERAIEKMLWDYELLEEVYDSLPKPTDFRIIGDTLMTWRKGYTIEETAVVLKIDPEVIETIRNKFQLGFRIKPFDSEKDIPRDLSIYLSKIKPKQKKPLHVMMGTTPSGPLHLANIITLASGTLEVFSAVREAGITDVRFTLGFNDSYALHNGHNSEAIDQRKERVQKFIDEMQRVYNIEITLQPFSDLQRTTQFRRILEKFSIKGKKFYEMGLYSSPKGKGKYERIEGDLNQLNYLEAGDKDFLPTYLLDLMALRDAAEGVDIHILGGDQIHAQKIIDPQRFVGDTTPFMYITGKVYGLNGREMHASDRNTITIDEILQFPDWLERIVEIKKQAQQTSIGPLEYRPLIPVGKTVYGLEHIAY